MGEMMNRDRLPEDDILVIDYFLERRRLANRGLRRKDNYLNGSQNIQSGPDCRELYPYIVTDPYPYQSILRNEAVREMIASSAMAVLPESERFDVVVGEDSSGRFPALAVGKAINLARLRNGQEPIARKFAAGKVSTDQNLGFRAQSEGQKALVVTEMIKSGDSVSNLLDALGRAGFQAVSLLTVDRIPGKPVIITTPEKYYMGETNSYTSYSDNIFYQKCPSINGVDKVDGEPHSRAIRLDHFQREKLEQNRKELDHFAKEIVDMWEIIRQK